MTIGECIAEATRKLVDCGIATARLDCLILLEDITGIGRASLLAHDDTVIPKARYEAFCALVARRCTHEPIAYIRGAVMFYGRRFSVNTAVLVPRPETEAIIEIAQKLSLPAGTSIADIGTGSGCIGITLALELPACRVDLYDIDAGALSVAQNNASALGASVQLYASNLLTSLHGSYDIIVTNLPYVPVGYPINEAAGFEPALALFAGIDGLDAYRELWRQISSLPTAPSHVITESLPGQHHANALLARNHGYTLEQTVDFIQHFVKH